MAVFSSKMGEERILFIQVKFRVFDKVKLKLAGGEEIKGEIVYIESDQVHITAPFKPIEVIKLEDIISIEKWTPPENTGWG